MRTHSCHINQENIQYRTCRWVKFLQNLHFPFKPLKKKEGNAEERNILSEKENVEAAISFYKTANDLKLQNFLKPDILKLACICRQQNK